MAYVALVAVLLASWGLVKARPGSCAETACGVVALVAVLVIPVCAVLGIV